MHERGRALAGLVVLILSLLTLSPHSALAADLHADPAPAAPVLDGYTYILKPGDTLWDVAVAHGITLKALIDANALQDPSAVRPGQAIRVPAPPPATPVPPTLAEAANTSDLLAPELPAPGSEAAAEAADLRPAASSIAPELSEWPVVVLDMINARRSEHGLAPLVWAGALAVAAQAHADDLANRNRGGHVGSDGAQLRERLRRAGYDASWASENWANSRGIEHAFSLWWNEPPNGAHRRNILGPNYSEIGIGITRGPWGYYFVVDFAGR